MELRYSFPIKIDFAGGRGVNARDNSNQGRLARSVISYQTNQLALEKIDADIGKRLKVSIGKGNVLNANQRLPRVTRSICFRHKIQSVGYLHSRENCQAVFSLFARRVLIVTTTRRAIPTNEMYQEGGAPSAIISERTAVKKKAPRMVPRMVPLPPVRRVPPTTTAAIDCSSIPVPRETLVEGFWARVTTADNPAKSEQRQNAEAFIRLTGTPW